MAGKTPAASDKLKTNVKGTLTTEANRFNIAGVVPSGPGPLLTPKPRKAHLVLGDLNCRHFMTVARIWQVTIWDPIILNVYALKKHSK
jgi:hypothetical protein